jgi:serine phosphatase RsbU (regulator of sigma subunit)
MKKLLLLVFLLLFSAPLLYAQTPIDSLKTLISKTENDSIKAGLYINIGNLLRHSEPNEAEKNYILAEKIALKNNYELVLTSAFLNRGVIGNVIGDFEKGIKYGELALELAKKYRSEKDQAKAQSIIGVSYYSMGDYVKALEHLKTGLELAEKIDDETLIQNCLGNIGHIYYSNEDAKHALEYYKKAMILALKSNNENQLSYQYQNIGNVFFATEDYDSAIVYYDKSVIIDKKTNNIYHLAYNYNNLGNIYSKLQNYPQTEKYYQLSYEVRIKLGDKEGEGISLFNLATLYEKLGKYKQAIEFNDKAREIFEANNSKEGLKNIYSSLASIYSKTGDLKNELINYRKYVALKDSIFNEEKFTIISDIEKKYESEKKQTEIIKLQAETDKKSGIIKRQELLRNSLIGIILLAFIAIGASFYAYQTKQKANLNLELKNKEITSQKDKIEHQKFEIIQSIHYAQRIQNALLPSEEVFSTIFPYSFVIFKPKDIVSGDFYWISKRGNKTYYVTADCTGHGVPGGFMSMLGTALLNEIIDERMVSDPGEILNIMREKIIHALKQADEDNKQESKDGMDLVLLKIDSNTLELEYAAANNSFYIVSNKQLAVDNKNCILQTDDCLLFELSCDKMPIGVYHGTEKPFKTYKYQLQRGDTIYTYTDGYADQFGGEKGKKYTYKRLREKLLAISMEPMEEQKLILESEFESWRGEQEQIDDVCLIGLKV